MKRVNKSVKLRLYPTKEQEVLLAKHFGCARFVYNYFLNLEKDTYQQTKKFNFYNKNAATLVQLKKDVQYEFLKEVNSQSLQWALKNLNQAFLNCFKHGHCKFPVFKSKYAKQSFKVPVNSSFKLDSRIHLPKFLSGIKFRQKTKFIDPKFNSVTISKTTSGQYFAAVQYEDDVRALPTNSNITAFDLGIKDFIVTDKNVKVDYPFYYKQSLDKIKSIQRTLSRKTKGSNNYRKTKLQLAKLHRKVANQRLDFLHKLTSSILSKNQVIVFEDLKNKQLLALNSGVMNQRLSDSSFGMFISLLAYKSVWYDRIAIKVKPKDTSRTCYECKAINTQLQLSDRVWVCPSCGCTLDRDLNAAKNILLRGLESQTFKDFHSTERAIGIKLSLIPTLDESGDSEKEAISPLGGL